MSGGKGGSQTTRVEVPEWLETAAQGNLARAEDISRIGYTPYYGPDVAAFTPMQQASFANTGQAAGAFGLPGGGLLGTEGMPQAQDFGGGLLGYSSAPLYEQSLAQLQQRAPGQYDYMQGMFIDPVTGLLPEPATQDTTQPVEPAAVSPGPRAWSDMTAEEREAYVGR